VVAKGGLAGERMKKRTGCLRTHGSSPGKVMTKEFEAQEPRERTDYSSLLHSPLFRLEES
jgi:hypothetical protein